MLPLSRNDLRDALGQLKEWIGDTRELRRTMRLDDSEHAALTERIKVVSDALQVRPDVKRRDGLNIGGGLVNIPATVINRLLRSPLPPGEAQSFLPLPPGEALSFLPLPPGEGWGEGIKIIDESA